MHSALLATHNIVRWLVLAAGVWAVFRVWRGWLSRSVWTDADAGAVKLFVNTLSLQFVVGLVLYGVSPLIRGALGDMGATMKNAPVRYFAVEHVVVMLFAIALGHIGAVRIRKAASNSARFQAATIFMGFALAAVAGFVPWGRPLFPKF
ncbi:MAG: hypothetical protein IPF98_02730 [Gemmatimonadetes bacterium]|nr:hypothetical protein [Gemmatimonadota bacterium]MCC6771142.1 hypothetical protein [Gemmatimonadaceae bacterium]